MQGSGGALRAAKNLGKRKWLVVVYKERSEADGFVITAYLLVTKPKGEATWRPQ